MKIKALKRIMAGVLSAVLVISGCVISYAAGIRALPYVENFDNYEDEAYATTFSSPTGNTGVSWFYIPGNTDVKDELYLCDDDDTGSGHGKVVKYVNNNTGANVWIEYRFPVQKSGRILIKYDIKVKNDSCQLAFIPRTDKYNNVWTGNLLRFLGGKAYFLGGTKESTYEEDEWVTVYHIFDIDNKTQETYYKDKVDIASISALNNLAAFDFYWNSKGVIKKEGDRDMVWIDNFEVKKLSGEVYLAQNGKEISDVYSESESLEFVIKDDDFTEVAEGITLTDFGANPLEYEEKTIDVNAEISDGKAVLNFSEPLKNGHRYKLLIPKGTRAKYCGVIEETVYEFRVADAQTTDTGIKAMLINKADGKSVMNQKGVKVSPEVKSISFELTKDFDEATLNQITVTGNDEALALKTKYNKSTDVYTVSFENYLKANTEYTITVPESVAGAELTGKLLTSEGKFEITNMRFTDAGGDTADDITQASRVRVTVINTAEKSRKLTLVGVSHEGYTLKGMYRRNFEITPAIRFIELECPVLNIGVDSVQGFLWNSIEYAVPVNSGIVMKAIQ